MKCVPSLPSHIPLNLYVFHSLCFLVGYKLIDLFHNGGQIKKKYLLKNNSCFKMRAVGLINIKTKECKSGRHL